MDPFISVLIPTRGRPKRLLKTLDSLRETSTVANSYEIILRTDDDDEETANLVFDVRDKIHAIKRKRLGYGRCSEMYREIAECAVAPWIWIMNDDCTVRGKGWDAQVKNSIYEEVIFQPEFYQLNESVYRGGGYTFPMVQNGCWVFAGDLIEPIDLYLDTLLRVEHKWPVKLLDGVTVYHERDNDDTLESHRKL